ncbi:MAG: hypothetical protein RhofKO_31280 [Rhodothermales bacterium]
MPYENEPTPDLPLRAMAVLALATFGTALVLWACQPADGMPALETVPVPEHTAMTLPEPPSHELPPIEADDVWKTLEGYTYETYGNFEYRVTFSEAVQALHATEVTLHGYIIPLEQGLTVTHFLLSTYPLADCSFCLPGGPESFVEVKADKPITFTYAPITLRGTFAVLDKEEIDEMGMFYQMTAAQHTEP